MSTHEYLYDGNGNLIRDKNKGIVVTYNYMNLPVKVDYGSGNRIEWTYTAGGAKLRKIVYTANKITKWLDYVSGFDYYNGTLDFFYTEEGRVNKLISGSLRYEYNITDHLGNSRVMFSDTGAAPDGAADILQESHYYAYGMRIEGLGVNSDNKYLYNGKELTDDFGLNWYEYGWRMYDAQLGRWHQVDPLDQYHSSYCFVGNNPINYFDLNGLTGDPIIIGSEDHPVEWPEIVIIGNRTIFDRLVNFFKQSLPSFETLWANYPHDAIRNDGSRVHQHPSSDGYKNQCAIRMGYCLIESGVDLSSYPDNKTSEGYPRGAKSLANWLEANIKYPEKMSQDKFETKYWNNGTGIIFLMRPAGSTTDHIDLFDGRINGNGTNKTGSGYYNASEVWFWEVK